MEFARADRFGRNIKIQIKHMEFWDTNPVCNIFLKLIRWWDVMLNVHVLLVRSGIFKVILFQEHLTGFYPNHISEFFQFNPHIWQSTVDILCMSEARLGQIWHSVSAYRVNNKSLSSFFISLKILTKGNDFFVCYILL